MLCADAIVAHPAHCFTASYDHTIRIWDVRSGQCTLTINHGSPVEALLVFPGTTAIISAGMTSMRTRQPRSV